MFDMTKTLTITARVKDFQWSNPHSWLYVLGSEPGKAARAWGAWRGQPQYADPQGLAEYRSQVGDKVTVVVIPLPRRDVRRRVQPG